MAIPVLSFAHFFTLILHENFSTWALIMSHGHGCIVICGWSTGLCGVLHMTHFLVDARTQGIVWPGTLEDSKLSDYGFFKRGWLMLIAIKSLNG